MPATPGTSRTVADDRLERLASFRRGRAGQALGHEQDAVGEGRAEAAREVVAHRLGLSGGHPRRDLQAVFDVLGPRKRGGPRRPAQKRMIAQR